MASAQSPVVEGSRLSGPRTTSSIPRATSVARRPLPLIPRATPRLTTGAIRPSSEITRRSTRLSTRASTALPSTVTTRTTARRHQDPRASASTPRATNTLSPSTIKKESPKNQTVIRHRSSRSKELHAVGLPESSPSDLPSVPSSPEGNVVFCPICFEDIKKLGRRIMATGCGHVFCNECLSAAVLAFKSNLCCPMCQQTVVSENFREIFL